MSQLLVLVVANSVVALGYLVGRWICKDDDIRKENRDTNDD